MGVRDLLTCAVSGRPLQELYEIALEARNVLLPSGRSEHPRPGTPAAWGRGKAGLQVFAKRAVLLRFDARFAVYPTVALATGAAVKR